MIIKNIHTLFFSPNGGTKKVTLAIADTIGRLLCKEVMSYDFTSVDNRKAIKSFERTDLVIIGLPVYAGRIPNKLLNYLENNLKGDHTIVVPICVYGNRSAGDTLPELIDILQSSKFHIIAGGSFIAKHAFSETIACNRPDQRDLLIIESFASEIVKQAHVMQLSDGVIENINKKSFQYYVPKDLKGEAVNFLKAKPKTNTDLCIRCGVCSRSCPMGSIDMKDVTVVSGICIKCHACINLCKQEAKYFDNEGFLSHKAMLERDLIIRNEPEVFIKGVY